MKLFYLLNIILLICINSSFAQKTVPTDPGHLTCGNGNAYIEYCKKNGLDPNNNPAYNDLENLLQAKIKESKSNKSGNRSGPTFIIPIVFHIVHVGGAENISDDQIKDQVRILNLDFRKLNGDTSDIVAAFQPIAADCEIEFRLAQKDALGNCVSGITRTYSNKTYDGDFAMVKEVNANLNGSSVITNIRFPQDQYLNVWICVDPQGNAGYTNPPIFAVFNPEQDGIWIRHDYVGSIGTSNVNRSRALTHEIGHWFNLSHTWGSSNNPGCDGTIMSAPCSGADNCSIDDMVTDTPNTIGWTSCNLSGSTCGSPLDNVQNFMEYSYCCNMYTEGQKTRMHTLLGLPIAGRNNLYSPTNLTLTGVDVGPILCAADFNSSQNFVCAGDSVSYYDATFNGATGWNYIFSGGTPITSTLENPTITYNVPGTYDVGLIANDGISYVNIIKPNYMRVLDPVGASVPFSEGFETALALPNSDWMIENFDGAQTWEIASGYGSTGTKCMMIDNFTYFKSGKDQLISNTYDLSGVGNAEIHFKYAYRQRSSTDIEKLKLFVSNSCGQFWSMLKQVAGTTLSGSQTLTSAYYPAPSDWVSFDVTNISAAYLTQGFIFKIEFESDYGNNIFIDDINLDINVGLDETNSLPIDFSVYPNPVTNGATINYVLPISQNIRISLKDVLGKEVYVLENGIKLAGEHRLQMNETQLPSKGVYFVCLNNGISTKTQKIIVK